MEKTKKGKINEMTMEVERLQNGSARIHRGSSDFQKIIVRGIHSRLLMTHLPES